MRVKVGLGVAVAVLAAALVGCGSKGPGVRVVGEKTVAKFDRPMVGDGDVGKELADSPLRIKPSVVGKFRWVDARTLAFQPEQALPRSTKFDVTVRAGTRALDGVRVTKAVTWSFQTERLAITLEAPKRWAKPNQEVTIRFNQPVRRQEVEKRCAYTAGTKRSSVTIDDTGETEEARTNFAVTPREPLALATTWRFVCSADLTGVEGPLGLAVVASDAKGNTPNEVSFDTYGPLKVAAVEPQGADVSPDGQSIVITFSNPISLAGDDEDGLPITIDPPIDGFPARALLSDEKLSYSVRGLKPKTRYTITIDASLTDDFNQKLPGRHVATFTTGDGSPRLDVETGEWVVEATRSGYPVWARNLTKIEATVAAVPEAMLPALARQLDWWDEKPVDAKKLGLKVAHVTIPIAGRRNSWDQGSD